jgi:hypothetical protein
MPAPDVLHDAIDAEFHAVVRASTTPYRVIQEPVERSE